jgi:hypothetical protein
MAVNSGEIAAAEGIRRPAFPRPKRDSPWTARFRPRSINEPVTPRNLTPAFVRAKMSRGYGSRLYREILPGLGTTARLHAGDERTADAIMREKVVIDPPLYVDLDGTIIGADTLVLSLWKLVRRTPWVCLSLPWHLARGRAAFKGRVARAVRLDPGDLPYREDVLGFLREEKSRGRTLVLATAAHKGIADAVANHVQLFDRVLASDDTRNLKGTSKLAAILDDAPSGVFDYAGDSLADLPVFERARGSILVHPSPTLLRRAHDTCRVHRVFE